MDSKPAGIRNNAGCEPVASDDDYLCRPLGRGAVAARGQGDTRNELTLSLNPTPTRQLLLAVCVVAVPVKLNSW